MCLSLRVWVCQDIIPAEVSQMAELGQLDSEACNPGEAGDGGEAGVVSEAGDGGGGMEEEPSGADKERE